MPTTFRTGLMFFFFFYNIHYFFNGIKTHTQSYVCVTIYRRYIYINILYIIPAHIIVYNIIIYSSINIQRRVCLDVYVMVLQCKYTSVSSFYCRIYFFEHPRDDHISIK